MLAAFCAGENHTCTSMPADKVCGEAGWPWFTTVVLGVTRSETLSGLKGSRRMSRDLAASYRTTCPFISAALEGPVRTESANSFPLSTTVSTDTTDPVGMLTKCALVICGKKLGSRIESDPDIAASECANQHLIVDRIEPLQHAAHQTYLVVSSG